MDAMAFGSKINMGRNNSIPLLLFINLSGGKCVSLSKTEIKCISACV